MIRARVQPGHIQPTQPLAHGLFAHVHRPPLGDLLTQISAPPAHHCVPLGGRPLQHHLPQFLHPRVGQKGRSSRTSSGPKSFHTFSVVAMHPVTQRLTGHPVQHRRRVPATTFHYQRNCQKAAHHRAIIDLSRQGAQRQRRQLGSGNLNRLAHRPDPLQAATPAQNRPQADSQSPHASLRRESGVTRAGITPTLMPVRIRQARTSATPEES